MKTVLILEIIVLISFLLEPLFKELYDSSVEESRKMKLYWEWRRKE